MRTAKTDQTGRTLILLVLSCRGSYTFIHEQINQQVTGVTVDYYEIHLHMDC